MRSVRRVLTVLFLLFVSATPLRAQVVSGLVVLADSVTPVAGVIVVASGANGVSLGRALTTARGTFSIAVPASGDVRLTVLRIGYRPSIGPSLPVVAGVAASTRIVFEAQPVVLSAINVRERETCRVQADSSLSVARVWEEARKAMLTTQIVSDTAPLVAEWIEYDRTLDTTSRLVREQRVRSTQHPTTHAFRSRPADVLASAGYVVADSSGTTYYAPDADVLLSEVFVGGHCFHLESSTAAGSANLIGVAFTPSRDRRESHDIEGTLWLDRSTAELRYLEYRYTNLPDVVASANPGGRVEFLRLPDGHWLVSRWSVRMPRLVTRDRVSEGGNRRIVAASTRLALRAVQVTGGEVIRAMRRDTVLYQAVGAGLALQVISRDTLVRAANATLELEATDYAATADVSGRIALSPVLPGRYHARVQTPLMRSLGVRPVERDVETHAEMRVDSLVLPTAADVIGQACPRDSVRNGEGMLFGSVKDERAGIVPNAAVTVGWQDSFSIVGTAAADKLAYRRKTLDARSDANGEWRICGVPRQMTLSVRVAADSGTDARDARLDDALFTSVHLVIHRQSAAAHEIAVATGQSLRPTALVEFAVVDTLGKPLPGTALEIFHGGGARSLVTGPTGRALLPEAVAGAIAVRARHVGYMPGEIAATVAAGRNTLPIVLSAVAAPMLDTMRVIGDRVVSGLNRNDEFELRRKNHQAAAFITREDIEKRDPVDLFQMLRGVPSIEVREMDGIMVAASTRSFLSGLNDKPCLLTVMVNGLIQQSLDLRQLPSPSEIHGVEVFAGAATIPLQYSGTGKGKMCGMIAVWTR